MDWQKGCKDKVVSAEEAAALVKSGDRIVVGLFQATPYTLCEAVAARASELKDVLVSHSVSVYPWGPRTGGAFKVESAFLTAVDRPWMDAGRLRYVPVGYFRAGDLPAGMGPFDVFLTKVSPPDEQGSCSFGPALWFHRTFVANSRLVIVEVDESLIRTGGDNFVHMSEIDRVVEMKIPPPPLPIVDGNPAFELYDFTYTDDLKVLLQLENFTSINNALMIDLTGQVTAETIGRKSLKGRAQEMIAIADPDFRPELQQEAKRLGLA